MEEEITAALLADAGIAAIVERRIHWDESPPDAKAPRLVLTTVDDEDSYTYEGRERFRSTGVQISAYAATRAAATALRAAVIAATSTMAGPLISKVKIERRRTGVELIGTPQQPGGQTSLKRADLDVRVWHTEP